MALPFNRCELCGTVTSSIEVSLTANNIKCAKFTLAVDRVNARELAEEQKQSVDYIPCEKYGNTAEDLAAYAGKGTQLWIRDGELRIDRVPVEKETGIRYVYYTKVIVKSWSLTGKREKEE